MPSAPTFRNARREMPSHILSCFESEEGKHEQGSQKNRDLTSANTRLQQFLTDVSAQVSLLPIVWSDRVYRLADRQGVFGSLAGNMMRSGFWQVWRSV